MSYAQKKRNAKILKRISEMHKANSEKSGGRTQPWTPHKPHWEQFPEPERSNFRESYEERAAIMEYHGGMSQGMAEQAAYSFQFADYPETIAAFVPEEEIERQVYRAGNIRRHFEKGKRIMARMNQ